MAARNVIQRTFDEAFKAAGMDKKSGAWRCASDEVVSLTDLQKSQYGPAYYVNQGWWLVGVEDGEPRPETCHVSARIELLVPTADKEVARILDLEAPMENEDRELHLRRLLLDELLPVIREASTVEGLRRMRQDGRLSGAALRGPPSSGWAKSRFGREAAVGREPPDVHLAPGYASPSRQPSRFAPHAGRGRNATRHRRP